MGKVATLVLSLVTELLVMVRQWELLVMAAAILHKVLLWVELLDMVHQWELLVMAAVILHKVLLWAVVILHKVLLWAVVILHKALLWAVLLVMGLPLVDMEADIRQVLVIQVINLLFKIKG